MPCSQPGTSWLVSCTTTASVSRYAAHTYGVHPSCQGQYIQLLHHGVTAGLLNQDHAHAIKVDGVSEHFGLMQHEMKQKLLLQAPHHETNRDAKVVLTRQNKIATSTAASGTGTCKI